jgi:DNA-binding transcriptional regulator YdaS (Cro superfamily)
MDLLGESMKLRDYLLQQKLTQAAFGRQITPSVSQGKVNHWLQGTRRVSLSEALQIQRLTGGAVTVEELSAQSIEESGPIHVVGTDSDHITHGAPTESLLRLANGLELQDRRTGLPDRRLVQQPFVGPERRVAIEPRRAVDRQPEDIGCAGQGV